MCMYFSLEYCGVEPKAEAMSPSEAPSVHSNPSAFIDVDQAPFIWCEPLLPFTLVRKLDHEWLVACILCYHNVIPHLQYFHVHVQGFFGMTLLVDLGFLQYR